MKKGIVLLTMCMVIGFMLPSCEKEVYDVSPTMEAYYTESLQLPSVSIDSVKSFSSKVNGFTRTYPIALEHEKYPLIKDNIKAASLRLNIVINDEWDGETHINF